MQKAFDLKPYNERTAFEQWAEYEGVLIIRDFIIQDLCEVEVKSWDRLGAEGFWIVLGAPEDQLSMASYVCEIAPGKSTKPQKHLFEELIYILQGSGATTVWNDGGKRFSFEWKRGSLFSPPLNTWHQHFNGSGTEAVRYVALTNAPAIFNTFHNYDFIMQNSFVFRDRFDDDPQYFQAGDSKPGLVWDSALIPDIINLKMHEFSLKAPGSKTIRIEMANNTLSSHFTTTPVGVYKKAHRHGPGAYIIILAGRGYSLMWREGEAWKRFDWGPGSMLSPPNRWFHQHFNIGREPIRQLALKGWGQKFPIGGWDQMFESTKAGGDMIEYEDEDPAIRKMYVEELAKEGIELKNPPVTYNR